MNTRPLFSVVIPTFQAGAKLDPTVASVLEQLPGGIVECLVVDGGSTDGTVERLRALEEQVPTGVLRWVSGPDAGIYDAMNQGINLATGRFLHFLGAGDRLQPGVLATVAGRIMDLPADRPRVLYGDVRWMTRGGARYGGRFSRARLCQRNICHQSMFYERSAFGRLGGYETRYPLMADWAFNWRCFGDKGIRKVYLPVLVADFEGGGASGYQEDANFRADHARLVRERLGLYAAFRHWVDPRILWRLGRLRNVFPGRHGEGSTSLSAIP